MWHKLKREVWPFVLPGNQLSDKVDPKQWEWVNVWVKQLASEISLQGNRNFLEKRKMVNDQPTLHPLKVESSFWP